MAEEQGLSAENRATLDRLHLLITNWSREPINPHTEIGRITYHMLGEIMDAARSEGPLPVGGEGREDLGSVGSGLTPLVPSPSASGLIAQPSTEDWAKLALDIHSYADHDDECAINHLFTRGDCDCGLSPLSRRVLAWAEGVAIKPTSDGEARQAKPAGDRTQVRTTPNLPPRDKP